MDNLLNQSGSVTMYDKNNAYLVSYKQPLKINPGKEYFILDGVLKEVVTKTECLPSPFADQIKKFAPRGFLPNHIYDYDSLKVWIKSNRGNLSQNSKKLEFVDNLEFNGHKFSKGFTLTLDLEYNIKDSEVYALYDIDGNQFYFLCTVEVFDDYFIINDQDGETYKIKKDVFFTQYSFYVGLYLSKMM